MSAERITLDANVLVYAADNLAGVKHDQAVSIILRCARQDCVLTVQALAEFYFAAVRKKKANASEIAAQVRDWVEIFALVSASPSALLAAVDAADKNQVSFWDALFLATAAAEGCTVVFSEDMQDGFRIRGLRVVNPFAQSSAGEVERLLGRPAG